VQAENKGREAIQSHQVSYINYYSYEQKVHGSFAEGWCNLRLEIIALGGLAGYLVAQLDCHLVQQITSLVARQLYFQAELDHGSLLRRLSASGLL